MSGVTDVEYRLLSQLAYYDEITEELNTLRGKDILPIKLNKFTKTLKKLDDELCKYDSGLLSLGVNYKDVLKDWCVLHSVQSILESPDGINAMNNAKYKNPQLDAFAFTKETFNSKEGIKKYLVISYRGTNIRNIEKLLKDLRECSNINNSEFFSENLIQSDWASVFFQLMHQKYRGNFEISLTGHSKGGALVQKVILIALQRDELEVSGVTFSTSGVLQLIEEPEEGMLSQSEVGKYTSLCRNFVIESDPVIDYIKLIGRNFKTAYVGKEIRLTHHSGGNAHRIASSFDQHFDENGYIKINT